MMIPDRPNSRYNATSVVGQAAHSASDTSLPSAVLAFHHTERHHRTRRRFSIEVRQASLHATPDEHLQLEALVTAVRQGLITLTDAQHALTALINTQQPKRHAA
jgi:hypothetical protein